MDTSKLHAGVPYNGLAVPNGEGRGGIEIFLFAS